MKPSLRARVGAASRSGGGMKKGATLPSPASLGPWQGAQVTAEEAWDLVNFIRDQQKKNPR